MKWRLGRIKLASRLLAFMATLCVLLHSPATAEETRQPILKLTLQTFTLGDLEKIVTIIALIIGGIGAY
jgi:hypothetical protein